MAKSFKIEAMVDQDRMKRRTKIVCTLGPASKSTDAIEDMLEAVA